jgi:hypothetical protein
VPTSWTTASARTGLVPSAEELSPERLAGERGVLRLPSDERSGSDTLVCDFDGKTDGDLAAIHTPQELTNTLATHAQEWDTGATAGQASVSGPLSSSCPPNTADKLRSGARVYPGRRGHEAAPSCWQRCRRKLRQLHPLVGLLHPQGPGCSGRRSQWPGGDCRPTADAEPGSTSTPWLDSGLQGSAPHNDDESGVRAAEGHVATTGTTCESLAHHGTAAAERVCRASVQPCWQHRPHDSAPRLRHEADTLEYVVTLDSRATARPGRRILSRLPLMSVQHRG